MQTLCVCVIVSLLYVAIQCMGMRVCVHMCMLAVYVKYVCVLHVKLCLCPCVLMLNTLTKQQPMGVSSLS